TIEHRFHAKLLGIDTAFLVDHGIAQETGSHARVRKRGQRTFRPHCRLADTQSGSEKYPVPFFIAGNLLDDEPIVREIAIEGADDPVTVGPYPAQLVLLITIGVGVTCRVEPQPAPALAVMRRFEHLLLVRVPALIREEGIDFRPAGRQADQIETEPAQ